jgi:hypothetical protein
MRPLPGAKGFGRLFDAVTGAIRCQRHLKYSIQGGYVKGVRKEALKDRVTLSMV